MKKYIFSLFFSVIFLQNTAFCQRFVMPLSMHGAPQSLAQWQPLQTLDSVFQWHFSFGRLRSERDSIAQLQHCRERPRSTAQPRLASFGAATSM